MTKEAKGFTQFLRKDVGLALGPGASATDPKFGDNKCNQWVSNEFFELMFYLWSLRHLKRKILEESEKSICNFMQ